MGPAYGDLTPEVEYGFMNGTRYTFTVNNVRDKSGEIVPDGTPVYVSYPYWLSTKGGQRLFPSEGQGYYVQANSGATLAQLITHGGTTSFEALTRDDLPHCWGGVEDIFMLLGTHTSHIDPFYPTRQS